MNCITPTPEVSRDFQPSGSKPEGDKSLPIPTQVYDLDTLKAECKALGLPTDRPTLRRVRRAIDLHQHGCVKPSSSSGIYTVQSQTDPDTIYVVIDENGCNCPDAKRMDVHFDPHRPHTLGGYLRHRDSMTRCKHEIAVLLYQEQLSDQEEYNDWLCEQYEAEQASIDDSFQHYDPTVDHPIL